MKAITLTQPWASLVALGHKQIETRSWPTRYRGQIAIHAAQGLGPVGGVRGLRELVQSEPFLSIFAAHDRSWGTNILRDPSYWLPRSQILAVASIFDSVQLNSANGKAYYWNEATQSWVTVPEPEASFGDYTGGRWGFRLRNVRKLERPIVAKGALGFWDWQPPEDFAS